MSQRRSIGGGWTVPTESESAAVFKNFAALQRIARIAAQAGADAQDINAARMWPLLWALEVSQRHELEEFAEIGRKVSNSRANEDRSKEHERNSEILSCACRLLLDGAKPRGLAAKIKKDTKVDLTLRQINRILNKWMPVLLSE